MKKIESSTKNIKNIRNIFKLNTFCKTSAVSLTLFTGYKIAQKLTEIKSILQVMIIVGGKVRQCIRG